MDQTYHIAGLHSDDELLGLPPNSTFSFIGEGSANVVYRVHPPATAPAEVKHFFDKMLLRIPKHGKDVFPYSDHQVFYHNTILPALGRNNLVYQRLVRIPLPGYEVLTALNVQLMDLDIIDENRRKDWLGAKIHPSPSGDASYGHAMLVESMSPRSDQDILLSIKPKWLAQSPSAPPNAKRCRVCARTARAGGGNEGDGLGGMCPLILLECKGNEAKAGKVWDVVAKAAGLVFDEAEDYREKFQRWLAVEGQVLLHRLREIQLQYDPKGAPQIVEGEDGGKTLEKLQTAMTLRDCSCYIRISPNLIKPVVRLGDLDRKNGKAKLKYWQDSERELVDGGFYVDAGIPVECHLNSV